MDHGVISSANLAKRANLVRRSTATLRHGRMLKAVSLAALGLGSAALTTRAYAQAVPPALPGQPGQSGQPSQPVIPSLPLPQPDPAGLGAANGPKVVEPAAAELREAGLALAERLVGDAQNALQLNLPNHALWRRAAAQLEAAARLDPNEPRFPRHLADVYGELGDTEGAIRALTAYRTLLRDQQQEEDPVAQIRLIELYVRRMQSNSERIDYLRGLVGKDTVAREVRSHAATMCVPLLLERSFHDGVAMLRQAIELNPYNPQARRFEYDILAASGTTTEQTASLLAMVRCNPGQPPILAQLARTLAGAGLVDDSLKWFASSLNLSQRTQTPVDPTLLVEYSTQLYRGGYYEVVEQITNQLLAIQADNVDAWVMRLLLHRDAAGARIAYDTEIAQLRKILLQRAGAAGKKIAGPLGGNGGVEGKDLNATVKLINDNQVAPADRDVFVGALIDAAWLEIFFARRNDDAVRWTGAIKALMPQGNVVVPRLEGWRLLHAGQIAEARVKLAPIQETDALAALGMVYVLRTEAALAPAAAGPATRPATQPAGNPGPATAPSTMPVTPPSAVLPAAAPDTQPAAAAEPATRPAGDAAALVANPTKMAEADALGKRLLTYKNSGLLGMLLSASLKEFKLQADALPEAAPIKKELEKFPIEWLEIVDRPEKFYILVGEPVRAAPKLGEPMLARIKLQNISQYEIPVGPGAVIGPDLWFDGRVLSAANAAYPMCGYDRVTGGLLLKPRNSIGSGTSQVVRIDQGALGAALRERPAASLNVRVTVTNNPIVVNNELIPGTAGMRRQFNKQIIRAGAPVNNEAEKKRLFDLLRGLPAEKMLAIDVLAAYIRQSHEKDVPGRVQAVAPEMRDQLERARQDPVPHVAAWASVESARLAEPASRESIITPLMSSKDWEVRLIGLLATDLLAPDARRRTAAGLAEDPDPQVQAVARAQVALVDQPPLPKPAGMQSRPEYDPSAVETPLPTGPAAPPAPGPATNPAGPPVADGVDRGAATTDLGPK